MLDGIPEGESEGAADGWSEGIWVGEGGAPGQAPRLLLLRGDQTERSLSLPVGDCVGASVGNGGVPVVQIRLKPSYAELPVIATSTSTELVWSWL